MRYRPDVKRFVGGLARRVVVEVVGAELERVRFVLPEGVSLRGAVPVWVRIGEGESHRLLLE